MAIDSNRMSQLDADQVVRSTVKEAADGSLSQKIVSVDSLISDPYDNLVLTYVVAGNGTGEIETVTYRQGVATVATLTLTYDTSNRILTVTRS